MSKTTRSSDKVRPETLSKRAAATKEKPRESSAALKKQTAGKVSSTPSVSREDAPSQLLRRTKTTASAIAQLEKGIESVHRRDFKKALTELQSLIEKYPNEAAIAVRARSYLDICRRGEASRKKTPAAHDQTYAMGVLEHNSTNYDKAIAYFQQSLEKYPRADYIYYSIAASLALKGNVPAAIENLRKAVELNRDSRIHAKNDPDFAALGSHTEFLELVGAPASRYRNTR